MLYIFFVLQALNFLHHNDFFYLDTSLSDIINIIMLTTEDHLTLGPSSDQKAQSKWNWTHALQAVSCAFFLSFFFFFWIFPSTFFKIFILYWSILALFQFRIQIIPFLLFIQYVWAYTAIILNWESVSLYFHHQFYESKFIALLFLFLLTFSIKVFQNQKYTMV